jgi:hypothetical protein
VQPILKKFIEDKLSSNRQAIKLQIKNPDSLNKIVIDIMKHFQHVLYMNIGEQDIKDKKISECLILNKSLKITYNPSQEPFQNMKHFSIEMDQYYTPNIKSNLS